MSRIAVVRKDRCNSEGCGDYLCIKLCPINRTGQECIIKSENNKPAIDESLCTGCGICPNRCPFDAISIINLPEELNNDPIHRYGQNDFSLYSLPMPIFGKVVGIVGKNGIGKSTAIKILAGVLSPNLGKDTQSSYEDLLEFFKGTEMQVYLEKKKAGKIKVAYKPQNVDLINKQAKGKVRELLDKINEKDDMDQVCDNLGLNKIMDHDIKTLSGGEMQRVAIAATVLKKANIYIFDEPTSYLDIKQRLIVSKFIKNLADEDTSVLVIEHDLVALDYMTNLIHIMYGKEGCYGVVSLPKPARVGINTYLDGFLRDENIRFRDSHIKFDVKIPFEESKMVNLTTWPELSKKLGKFSLKASSGEIYRNEIVGILGENAIGKTTFVKILAGELKPDSGVIDSELKVAYKPQYIDTDSDELVIIYLANAFRKYVNQIVKPLGISLLQGKKLNELSGGQLQRVSIAKALSQDANLVLLDEPSAYLDVEQRLLVSKVIRNVVDMSGFSVLVVDHDLVFLDYLSNRLLVFDGETSVSGSANGPFNMEKGMNSLLTEVNITLRRDKDSGRPRINKPGSQKDQQQKKSGNLYYA
jgi:ATP-binding cassette, sub-family E, member 1